LALHLIKDLAEDKMANDLFNSFMTGPDEKGRFGDFGGRFVSETLMPLILELEEQYNRAKTDDSFWAEMNDLWTHYVGRPSPLYHAERLSERLGGAKIYMKRDELNHTGAHGKNADHRRDRRGTTWRCNGDRMCEIWLEMCGLYGRA
jgi:hypothetical protein